VQREADPWTDLEPGDRGGQRRGARHWPEVLRGREQHRHDQRRAVQRRQRMKIVEFEALDERAVEQHRGGAARGGAGTDHHRIPGTFETEDGPRRDPRPRQLRTHQPARDAVQEQVLGPDADPLGNLVERQLLDPARQRNGDAGGRRISHALSERRALPRTAKMKENLIPGTVYG
jgi:hypothetical protein